mmetsp:Transcript_122102/g.304741  ORF Transcript_122102/g.304741 Transcript_122102/m.304741 type:complete len:217 (-) Transcript_122102:1029-1679(-)
MRATFSFEEAWGETAQELLERTPQESLVLLNCISHDRKLSLDLFLNRNKCLDLVHHKAFGHLFYAACAIQDILLVFVNLGVGRAGQIRELLLHRNLATLEQFLQVLRPQFDRICNRLASVVSNCPEFVERNTGFCRGLTNFLQELSRKLWRPCIQSSTAIPGPSIVPAAVVDQNESGIRVFLIAMVQHIPIVLIVQVLVIVILQNAGARLHEFLDR